MNADELNKMVTWIAENANRIDVKDQLHVYYVTAQFAEAIKPIYDKYNKPFGFEFYPFN